MGIAHLVQDVLQLLNLVLQGGEHRLCLHLVAREQLPEQLRLRAAPGAAEAGLGGHGLGQRGEHARRVPSVLARVPRGGHLQHGLAEEAEGAPATPYLAGGKDDRVIAHLALDVLEGLLHVRAAESFDLHR